eukprot:5581859-Amphidinium_carterae.1
MGHDDDVDDEDDVDDDEDEDEDDYVDDEDDDDDDDDNIMNTALDMQLKSGCVFILPNGLNNPVLDMFSSRPDGYVQLKS